MLGSRKVVSFNPRTPCGVRPIIRRGLQPGTMFQSTHSLRSATQNTRYARYEQDSFNPRTPCGVRPCRTTLHYSDYAFQSTHSLRSATIPLYTETVMEEVSIHALLAECDYTLSLFPTSKIGFNPRTPCGVRLVALLCITVIIRFNPRTPCGVRPPTPARKGTRTMFQSTHSLRSATFQKWVLKNPQSVSIHALLAECDQSSAGGCNPEQGFNPRTPCGVRLRLTIYIVIQQRKRYFAPTSRRRPSSPSLLF